MRSDEVNQQFKDRRRVLRAIDLALSQVSHKWKASAEAVHRKIAVVVVIAMKELLGLITMQRYIRRIEVQNNLGRRLSVTSNESIPEHLVCLDNHLAIHFCLEPEQG